MEADPLPRSAAPPRKEAEGGLPTAATGIQPPARILHTEEPNHPQTALSHLRELLDMIKNQHFGSSDPTEMQSNTLKPEL